MLWIKNKNFVILKKEQFKIYHLINLTIIINHKFQS